MGELKGHNLIKLSFAFSRFHVCVSSYRDYNNGKKSCSNIQNLRKSKVCWWKWLRSHYWEYIRIEMLVLDLLALINDWSLLINKWIDKF